MSDDTPDTPDTSPETGDLSHRDTPGGGLSRDTGDAPDTRDTSPRSAAGELVSQPDAAALAGVSVRTLQRAVRRGELESVRRDGRAMYRAADVVSWSVARDAPAPAIATAPPAPSFATPLHEAPAPPPVAFVSERVAALEGRVGELEAALAARDAELAAVYHELAFAKDVAELEREGRAADQARSDRSNASLLAAVTANTQTIREMLAMIREMQDAARDQGVSARPTGMPPEGPQEALQRTTPPSAGDSSLSGPSRRPRRRPLWWPWPLPWRP